MGACFSGPATADDRAGYPAPHKMAAAYQPGMQAPSGVVSGYPAAPPYPQHSYMPASHSQPLPPAAQHSGYWSMPPAYSYPQPGYGGGAYPPPYPGMPPPVGALPPPQPGQYGPQGRRFGGGMGAGGAAMMGAGAGLLGGLLIAYAMTPDCMGGCDMGGGMDVGGGF